MFDLACVIGTQHLDGGRSGRQISEAEQVNPGEKNGNRFFERTVTRDIFTFTICVRACFYPRVTTYIMALSVSLHITLT